jgi:four helix bundle protein
MKKQGENLKVQFRARLYKYVLRLLGFITKLPSHPVLKVIIIQLIRSGTSVGANYFEAVAASSKKDFQNFFSHCLKSANETKFWLALIRDSKLMPEVLKPECEYLLKEITEVANIFASSILTMKGGKK